MINPFVSQIGKSEPEVVAISPKQPVSNIVIPNISFNGSKVFAPR